MSFPVVVGRLEGSEELRFAHAVPVGQVGDLLFRNHGPGSGHLTDQGSRLGEQVARVKPFLGGDALQGVRR